MLYFENVQGNHVCEADTVVFKSNVYTQAFYLTLENPPVEISFVIQFVQIPSLYEWFSVFTLQTAKID